MLDLWIDEFLAVSKYLNISRAAEELHMTQSNLSRHIKQMEKEIGFCLFTQNAGHLTLTPAGVEYAENLASIMTNYRTLTKRCAEISENTRTLLPVQMAPYPDEAGKQYLRFLDRCINKQQLYEFDFLSESRSRKSFISCVLNKEVAISVIYLNEKPDEAAVELSRRGLSAHFLAEVPLGVWIANNHEFAKEKEVSIEQLAQLIIVFPNNPSSPLKEAYIEMLARHQFEPNYKEIHTGSRLGFVFHQDRQSSYLFPLEMKDSFILSWQEDRIMIPIKERFSFNAYAIAAQSSHLI